LGGDHRGGSAVCDSAARGQLYIASRDVLHGGHARMLIASALRTKYKDLRLLIKENQQVEQMCRHLKQFAYRILPNY